ncbi:MAG TPA: hypothetical protein PLE11_04055 [Bacteroidales bacterium]|nr:hypothetical protein [Bacteroidales bacterium]
MAISLSIICCGQDKYLPVYFDYLITKQHVDSLLNLNVKEVIIVRTDKAFNELYSEDSILTFICWQQIGTSYIRIVTQDKIFKVTVFNGESIFNFKNKKKTFVTDGEEIFKFTPPLTNNNAVFYYTTLYQGYFEQPDKLNSSPMRYYPNDQNKEKLRKEWFSIIISVLLKEDFDLKVESIHDRYKELGQ